MSRTFEVSRQFRINSLGLAALCLLLAACGDMRVPQACHEYFSSNDTEGYQLLDAGVALHVDTNLAWYRCPAGQRFSEGQCLGESLLLSWEDANNFAAEFSQNSVYQWRLPTNSEFRSITTKSCRNPALNPNVFPRIPVENYWTADKHMIASSRRCMIYIFQGQITCREPGIAEHPFMLVTTLR